MFRRALANVPSELFLAWHLWMASSRACLHAGVSWFALSAFRFMNYRSVLSHLKVAAARGKPSVNSFTATLIRLNHRENANPAFCGSVITKESSLEELMGLTREQKDATNAVIVLMSNHALMTFHRNLSFDIVYSWDNYQMPHQDENSFR